MSASTSVLIADNQLLTREGIKTLIGDSMELKIVGEAMDSAELLDKLKLLAPDLIIIDYHLPGFFAVEDIAKIYNTLPHAKVLVVTTNQNKSDIVKVLEYGVNNYILKECDKDEFVSAVYATIKGERFFCGKVIDAVLDKHQSKEEHCEPTILSKREVQIVKLISQGMTNGEIAEAIFLSVHTVSTHRKNILKKLGLKKSAELVAYALKMGLITQHE